jgi:hypothetical protein
LVDLGTKLEESMERGPSTNWLRTALTVAALCAGPTFVPLALASPFTTETPASYTFGNHKFAIFLPVKNTGKTEATDIMVTTVTFGNAKLASPSLPAKMGNIDADATGALYLNFNDQNLVAGQKYGLTVHGTYVADGSKSTFTLTQTIEFGVSTVFQLTPHPLTVTPSADPTHSARAVISAANGGTITTTGADGTIFTFTLPPNALLSDEEISMTPVSALNDLPSGGTFVAGVEFQPEGLILMQPGMLTIAPKTAPPSSELLAYGYQSGGGDFHLEPSAKGSPLTIGVRHFSGYGSVYGAIINELTSVAMSNAIDSLTNELTACGANSACQADLMQEFYDQVLVPTDNAAVGNDAYFAQAIGYTAVWLALMKDVSGLSTLFQSEIESAFSAVLSVLINYFDRGYKECTTTRANTTTDLVHMLTVVDLFSWFKLQGIVTTQIPNTIQKVEACIAGPLEFSFDSTIAGSSAITDAEDTLTNSTVSTQQFPLQFDVNSVTYTGNGPLAYDKYSYSINWNAQGATDCSSGVGNPGTIAISATFDLNNITTLVPNPNQIRMQVTLMPRIDESDTLCLTGPAGSVSNPEMDAYYDMYFAIAHGGTGFNGYPPSPYFVNLNTPTIFNFAGTSVFSSNGVSVTYTATENSKVTITQTSP